MDLPEEFVRQLTSSQGWLYGYIFSLLGDPTQAEDVLQNTNLVLWKKAEEFRPGSKFSAWAGEIAYYQVLAHRRDNSRDRHLFDDELLSLLAQQRQDEAADLELAQRQALRKCLSLLPKEQRQLLDERYTGEHDKKTLKEIARTRGESSGSLATALHRIRRTLFQCIERKLRSEPTS